MGQLRRLPKRAEIVESVDGIIHGGPRDGQRFYLARYRVPGNFADGGTEFVTIQGPEFAKCFRYGGRNVEFAAHQISKFRIHLIETGQTY